MSDHDEELEKAKKTEAEKDTKAERGASSEQGSGAQTSSASVNGLKKGYRRVSLLPERLPRPTAWPATLALGVTFLAFGVVTHWVMSVAGLGLFLIGAGGWFEDLRNDQLQ